MEKDFSTKKFLLSLVSIVVLILTQTVALTIGNFVTIASPSWIGNIITGIAYVLLAYVLLRFLCVKLMKSTLENFGIGRVKLSPVWVISAFALPIIVSSVFLLMPGEWTINALSSSQKLAIVTDALFFLGLAVGIVEEMVFRGVIMHALEKKWNKVVAVLLPSMAFGLLHVIGRDLDFVSILFLFVAGTSVGVLFSLVVYATGSIWNSALIHVLWNFFMIGGIISIDAVPSQNAMFFYTLDSKSMLITGGAFGIESSIIAVIGYLAFALLAFFLWKKKATTQLETVDSIEKKQSKTK